MLPWLSFCILFGGSSPAEVLDRALTDLRLYRTQWNRILATTFAFLDQALLPGTPSVRVMPIMVVLKPPRLLPLR